MFLSAVNIKSLVILLVVAHIILVLICIIWIWKLSNIPIEDLDYYSEEADDDFDYYPEEIDEELAEEINEDIADEPNALVNAYDWVDQPFDPSTWKPSESFSDAEKLENARKEFGYWVESIEAQEWAKKAMEQAYAEQYGINYSE